MKLRKLNSTGIQEFRNYITRVRKNPELRPPLEILQDDSTSEYIVNSPEISRNIRIVTKLDLSEYLTDILEEFSDDHLYNLNGLWSWLGLYYFDLICPVDSRKQGKVRREELYIYNGDLTDDYQFANNIRHLIWAPFMAKRNSGGEGVFLQLSPIHMHGDTMEAIGSRVGFFRNMMILRTLDKIYTEKKDGNFRMKPGGVTRGEAGLRDFIKVVQQLELTYDMYGMKSDDLISLLPDRFHQKFINK